MFNHCHKFNQDLSNWKFDNIKQMYCMFNMCTSFDKYMKLNIPTKIPNSGMFNIFKGCPKVTVL